MVELLVEVGHYLAALVAVDLDWLSEEVVNGQEQEV